MEKSKQNQRKILGESASILRELYADNYTLKDENGNEIKVPEQGSISLLASGYKGLIAMRLARQQSGFNNTNVMIIEKTKDGDTKEPK